MPISFNISVKVSDKATPALNRSIAFLQGDDLKNLVGRMAVNAFGANFENKNLIPNAIGGPRTNYYSDAAKATNFSVSGDTVTITVAQVGIALHYYGGTITPGKNNSYLGNGSTKYLTIPARPEAHGKRASDFPDLVVLWGKKGPYGLGIVEKVGVGVLAGKPTNQVYFWLVKSATIAADPTIVPSQEALIDPIREQIGLELYRVYDGGAP